MRQLEEDEEERREVRNEHLFQDVRRAIKYHIHLLLLLTGAAKRRHSRQIRFFNTSGPVVAENHYLVAPLERVNLTEILSLVADKRYFVLHAPRQTGKPSALLALRDLLNAGAHGDYRCVYVNVEAGQAAREN